MISRNTLTGQSMQQNSDDLRQNSTNSDTAEEMGRSPKQYRMKQP